jgi:hypothetical protein
MESRTTRQFWRLFHIYLLISNEMPSVLIAFFAQNPAHPGLGFKRLEGEDASTRLVLVSTTALLR